MKALVSRLRREQRRAGILSEIEEWFPGNLAIVYPELDDPIAHFRSRHSPRFYWDSESISESLTTLPEKTRQEYVEMAHEYRSGVWRFRGGAAVTSKNGIPWDASTELEEIGRDLHRLEWLVDIVIAGIVEQDDSALTYVADALDTWVAHSGPSSRYWEDIYEIAQRSECLLWLLFLTRNAVAMPRVAIEQLLACLAASGRLLFGMLEYHRPNNHLVIQAVRLAELGILLPEAAGSDRWRALGYDVGYKEIEHQILPDGVHAERSIFYHRIVLDTLLQFRVLQQRNCRETPKWIDDRLRGMLRFQRSMRRPDGDYPQYNDGYMNDAYIRLDAGRIGRVLFGEGVTEGGRDVRTCLVAAGIENGDGSTAGREVKEHGSQFFPDGGFFVHNDPLTRCQMSFRCGKLTYPASPAHMHADPLALEIFDNEPLIVSSGTYSFNNDIAMRNDFRGTAAHNCLTVDDADAVALYGMFGVGRLPKVTQRTLLDGGSQVVVEAAHDGYARSGAIHSRLVASLGACAWIVIDAVGGSGTRDVALWWHFHPLRRAVVDGDNVIITHRDGVKHQVSWFSSRRLRAELKHGGDRGYEGWFSRNTGELSARDTVRIRGTVPLPFVNATIIRRLGTDRRSSGHIQLTDPTPLACKIGGAPSHESNGRVSIFWQDEQRTLICVIDGSFLKSTEIGVQTNSHCFLIQVEGNHCNAVGEHLETLFIDGVHLSSAAINGREARLSPGKQGSKITKEGR